MQYFGGKARIAKQLVAFIQALPGCDESYHEPCCGALWVGSLIKSRRRIFGDVHPDLIAMWQAVQQGWVPPTSLTEDEYRAAKALPSPHPLRAFAGFGCSFAGRFFEGYARCAENKSYAAIASRSIAKKTTGVVGAEIRCEDGIRAIRESLARVVYADPPYKGTTKYSGTATFNHDAFWQACRTRSRIVVVSEYSAPADFVSILDIPTKTRIRDGNGVVCPRVERLFIWRCATYLLSNNVFAKAVIDTSREVG